MMLWNALSIALREIHRNVMRSVLTILGIVIGVGAVIVMVTLGNGASLQVTEDIARLGENLLTVTPGSVRRGPVAPRLRPIRSLWLMLRPSWKR